MRCVDPAQTGRSDELASAYAEAATDWLKVEGWPRIDDRRALRLRVLGRERTVILAPSALPGCTLVLDGRSSWIALLPRPAADEVQR
jgi:hypothetical protein